MKKNIGSAIALHPAPPSIRARTDGFDRFICKIDGVCAGESPLNEQGRPNSRRLMSALEMTACEYRKTGDVPGKCMTFAGDVK